MLFRSFSRGTTTFACDGTYALSAGLYSSNSFAMVVTAGYVSDGNAIQTSFKYNRGIGAVTGNVFLYYDVNNSGTWQQIATSSNLSGGCTLLSAFIPSADVPAGSVVRFRMQINSTSNISVFIDDFKAIQQPFIMEYTFNNTFNNVDGALPFTTGVSNASFVPDRNGNASSAVQINANVSGIQTVIGALPKTNAPRSFSIWYKTSANNNVDLFTYGTACANCTFGTYIGTNGNLAFANGSTGTNFGGTYPINIWRHLLITYNGTDVKLFLNGQLLGTAAHALVTGNNSSFRLGGPAATITVDDLKIYDRALTDTQALNLYNYNTLTAPLTISNINAASITTNSAAINYSLNTINFSATSNVRYGLTSGNLTNTVTGFSVLANTTTPGTISITGLMANRQYFYIIEATNSQGTINSTEGSFTTLASPMSAIAEYNFDNTHNNILGSRPFAINTGTSFTQDRNGNANSALNLVSIGTTATIPNLPYSSTSRTISVWAKNYSYNSFVGTACPFSYGTTSNTYEFIIAQSALALNPYSNASQNHGVDLTPLSMTNALNTWYHYVVSYNGTTSKIYKDGVLLSTRTVAILPTSNNSDIFKLGLLNALSSGYFDGAIDDLKVYNYALSDADVTSLYTNNTLSSSNFNQNNLQVAVYPNPANNILNVEVATDLKSIEIYNIQGQKVLSSTQKQLNITDLQAGIYMIKIEDTENAIATKKFVKQ